MRILRRKQGRTSENMESSQGKNCKKGSRSKEKGKRNIRLRLAWIFPYLEVRTEEKGRIYVSTYGFLFPVFWLLLRASLLLKQIEFKAAGVPYHVCEECGLAIATQKQRSKRREKLIFVCDKCTKKLIWRASISKRGAERYV